MHTFASLTLSIIIVVFLGMAARGRRTSHIWLTAGVLAVVAIASTSWSPLRSQLLLSFNTQLLARYNVIQLLIAILLPAITLQSLRRRRVRPWILCLLAGLLSLLALSYFPKTTFLFKAYESALQLIVSTDMLQNFLAEIIGIILTVFFIQRLLRAREEEAERKKWSITRERVGKMVGWAHTILSDQLAETPNKNGYEIVHAWCEDVLEETNKAKQQYSFAFTAKMAEHLEWYEADLRQTIHSIRNRGWRNLDTLKETNEYFVDFAKACHVSESDIDHIYVWSQQAAKYIRSRLKQSDLTEADVPNPSPYIRF